MKVDQKPDLKQALQKRTKTSLFLGVIFIYFAFDTGGHGVDILDAILSLGMLAISALLFLKAKPFAILLSSIWYAFMVLHGLSMVASGLTSKSPLFLVCYLAILGTMGYCAWSDWLVYRGHSRPRPETKTPLVESQESPVKCTAGSIFDSSLKWIAITAGTLLILFGCFISIGIIMVMDHGSLKNANVIEQIGTLVFGMAPVGVGVFLWRWALKRGNVAITKPIRRPNSENQDTEPTAAASPSVDRQKVDGQ